MPSPDIESFKTVLRRGRAAFIPLAELGIHQVIKEQFLGKKLTGLSDDVEFWYKAGYDYIKLQPAIDFNPISKGLDGKTTQSADGSFVRKWAHGKGVITSFEEYEQYIFPEVNNIDYRSLEQVKSLLPDGMGVIGQYGDIFTMTWEMMGFEEFSLALFLNQELVQTLNNHIGSLVYEMFEYMAQSDFVDVLWYSDDIAYTNGLLVSPDVLKEYFFPWLKKIGDLAKRYNKPFIYHTDGILYDVMKEIIASGVDALHPIEPKAMKIADVKKQFGDKLSLIGNVDVDLLARGTSEQVRAQVIRNIEEAGYNGGYCVGSGNSIPEYVNFENYMTMIKTTKEFSE